MKQTRAMNLGLAVGGVVALWHAGWALCVALGWAQPIVDFALWVHFISLPLRIEPFSAGRAILLIAATGAIGFAFGGTAGLIWNAIHSARRSDVASRV